MGAYSIDTKDLPDGDYTLIAWHEVYGEQAPVQVKVAGGKAEVNFTISADKKAAAQPVKDIRLAAWPMAQGRAAREIVSSSSAV